MPYKPDPHDNDDDAMCGDCGKPCTVKRIDVGHGAWTVGSEHGVHHDYRRVSDCCEAATFPVERD